MTSRTVFFHIDPNSTDDAPMPSILGYALDEQRAGRLWHGWARAEDVEGFVRRSMEIAIKSALGASEVRELPEHASDWKTAEAVAIRALHALTELQHYMAYGTRKVEGEVPVDHLMRNLRQLRRIEEPSIHVDAQERDALDMAATLYSASGLVGRIAEASGAMRKRVSGAIINFGEVERTAFASIWGETWLALYNKRPSSSRGADNAFGAFLALAWEDATGEAEVSFGAVLAKALSTLGEPGAERPPRPAWAWA